MKNLKFTLLSALVIGGFAFQTQAQNYCTPQFMEGCTEGYTIDDFIFDGENGTKIEDLSTGCANGAYDDKSNLPPLQLYQGKTYVTNISTNIDPDGVPMLMEVGVMVAIWIDFNDDGEFEMNERVAVSEEMLTTSLSDLAVQIPANAQTGSHRMRIVAEMITMSLMAPGGGAEDISPCPSMLGGGAPTGGLSGVSGEVHDYTVIISEAGADGCGQFFVNLGGNQSLCEGTPLVLDATTPDATSYSWSNGATTPTISVTTGGTYTVTITSEDCGTITDQVTVTLLDAPSFDDITVYSSGNAFSFGVAGASNVTGYSWDLGDGNTSTAQTVNHNYASDGTYTVTLTVTNECGEYTDEITVQVGETSGIQESNLTKDLQIFPNPASSILNIRLNNGEINAISIKDVLGQEVLVEQAKGQNTAVQVAHLPQGTYFINIETTRGNLVKKLMLVH